jgi:putative peptidoglycan lipid II flippase
VEQEHHPAAEIVRKGSVITFITLVSRPLGYVREAIQAYLFGATLLVDAFIVAFNFPELIQTLFFSGATSAFLIPVCTKYLKDDSEYSAIYSTFINLSLIVTVALSLAFLFFTTTIVHFIAPGFSPETKAITARLFIIMIPVISLHTLLSVMKAFLNARDHFAAPELSGILWNIAFIVAAVALAPKFGIYSLAVGVTAGSVLQVVMQIPYLRRLKIRYRPILKLGHPSLAEARRLFAGALIATSIVPINSFVGRIIASYLPQGEVASLAYAFRLFVLPFSLFAVPVYTVMFARMSKLFHDNDRQAIFSHIDSAVLLLSLTLIPSTVVLCATGDLLVQLLYQRGAFTARETAMTARALVGYGTGLLFYALSISFVRIFNAIHDVKTPALVGLTSIGLNALLAYLLMLKLNNLGIALATSIVSLYNFVILFAILRRRLAYRLGTKTLREVIKSLAAGLFLATAIVTARQLLPAGIILPLIVSGFLTVLIYGLFFRNYYINLIRRRI